jgi:hypothetical protein
MLIVTYHYVISCDTLAQEPPGNKASDHGDDDVHSNLCLRRGGLQVHRLFNPFDILRETILR